MIKAIAFLGNYGREYSKTRHNVAWIFSSLLASTKNLNWQNKFTGEYAKDQTYKNSYNLHFIKPHTYMNLSGVSVSQMLIFYKIESSSLLVVHDEVELPLATISLKYGGSLKGHNGLRSIKDHLGTQDFWHLKIGIGRPSPKGAQNIDMASYVLSSFSDIEENLLLKCVPTVDSIFSSIYEEQDFTDEMLKKYSKVSHSF